MTEPQRGVSPPVAVAFATVGFFALLIAGFGMLSLLADADVLAVGGLGQAPGVVGVAVSVVVFVLTVWRAVRRPQPSYGAVAIVVVATVVGYVLGVLVGALLTGVDAARATAAAGSFATSWFAVVLASAALVAGWAAVALVRTRARRPRWPWESGD